MRNLFFLLLLGVTSSLFASEQNKKIYVWRNAEGVLVFSDSPKPNVQADTVTIINTPNITKSVDASILKGANLQPITDEVISIYITKPKAEQTIRNNDGTVYINGMVKPVFKRGMRVVLFLDGERILKPQKSAVFILHDLDRGEHTIRLDVLNNSGKVIAVSNPITFYLHRNSIYSPN